MIYYTFILLTFLFIIVRGRVEGGVGFYSSSGGKYLRYNEFSEHMSISKFLNNLKPKSFVSKNASVITIGNRHGKIIYGNNEYCFEPSTCSIDADLGKRRTCVIHMNEIAEFQTLKSSEISQEFVDLKFGDELSRPTALIWSCRIPNWCCGAECCSQFFKFSI
ncbi:unnamed protein product [Dracunculus medinensis]|uniref:CX domain-containing protein n=1 Tax=Dracunculus medinensis TaxID=318479 RepID=A0A0N4UQD5_DRAME|nr:unnamed protein product [Dracunculus medinensis]